MYPACKPYLPTAEELLPYLREIDENRFYTNFGPMVHRFENRMAENLGLKKGQLVTCSSGMSGLELSLQAFNLPGGSYAMTPSWTFNATAMAALNLGLLPFFVDVDKESWCLTPEIAEEALKNSDKEISVIMPVSAFGAPLPVKEWERISQKHNVRVLIDGAAMSFEDIEASETIPVMLSLHATKLLNAGEGGLIVCKDEDFITRVKEQSMFGLVEGGIKTNATNAKMSEYHAAVANASLDRWNTAKQEFMRIARQYRKNISGNNQVRLLPDYGKNRFNSMCLITCPSPDLQRLEKAGIGTRQWWRKGCHNEPVFKGAAKTDLTATVYLSENYTGLPCYVDLTNDDVDYICEQVLKQ